MAKPLLPDELWERIEPLLPPPKPRRFRFPGRKPLDNRKALTGILFVLKTRHPVGVPAAGDGLRQRHDLLATASRLASRRGLAASSTRSSWPS